jgi:hypothetical protein
MGPRGDGSVPVGCRDGVDASVHPLSEREV